MLIYIHREVVYSDVRGNVASVPEVNEVVREVPVESGETNRAGDSPMVEDEEEEVYIDRDKLVNPAWIEDPRLGRRKGRSNERKRNTILPGTILSKC